MVIKNIKYVFALLFLVGAILLVLGLPLAALSHLVFREYSSFSPLHHPWCFAFVLALTTLGVVAENKK